MNYGKGSVMICLSIWSVVLLEIFTGILISFHISFHISFVTEQPDLTLFEKNKDLSVKVLLQYCFNQFF